eukprot:jgi/Botrbrau1/6439/Bobra.0034s0015.1
MRKKLDSRIRTLVENGVKLGHRTIFMLVGDKGRDQVVNLHYMLSKLTVKARPSVLWCYKDELHFSSHRKKRAKQIKRQVERGLLDASKEDPFALFVASTSIRYCYYKETHKILGNTYGMCVLQDFEALTPNLLARTIETVEGGGLVIMLLSTMTSLTQLYSLTMDVHSRFRTESHSDVTPRFNERLVLSLAGCRACLLMDDELNILPTSSHVNNIQALQLGPDGKPLEPLPSTAASAELRTLTDTLAESQPAGPLVAKCRTLDQARAVITFLDAASEKTLRSTVALTAARGRGKSAALGLAVAGAIGLGYSNIFVTAPSPENLRTLFEFIVQVYPAWFGGGKLPVAPGNSVEKRTSHQRVFARGRGFDALEYKEHLDYELVRSTNPAFGKAIIRINIFRTHRQTVQYIHPKHHDRLGQAELLVIDEAAAIPLPLVRAMLGPYLVFLCSTVNGYEGTGRSLSIKLLQQLRAESAKASNGADLAGTGGPGPHLPGSRVEGAHQVHSGGPGGSMAAQSVVFGCCRTCTAGAGQPTAPEHVRPVLCGARHAVLFPCRVGGAPAARGGSFGGQPLQEPPDDLLLLADAPAHRLFLLFGPLDETKNALPDLLAVVQVVMEGAISKASGLASLREGRGPQGDMVPWAMLQQYRDLEFLQLSGARIVRIAVHPDLPKLGYGSRALALLRAYYQGDIVSMEEEDGGAAGDRVTSHQRAGPSNGPASQAVQNGSSGGGLLAEKLRVRTGLPPLLVNLADRRPESLQYMSTSYGLTQHLYSFWRKNGFLPVYLRQNQSDITGEHTVMMLSPLTSEEVKGTDWVQHFVGRLPAEVPGPAHHRGVPRPAPQCLVLSMLDPRLSWEGASASPAVPSASRADGSPLSIDDLNRLEAYCNSAVDHHVVRDLWGPLAHAFFSQQLPVSLSVGQATILVALGLQARDVDSLEAAMGLPANQILALFNKAVKKMFGALKAAKVADVEKSLPKPVRKPLKPHAVGLDEELQAGALEAVAAMRKKVEDMAPDEDLAEALGDRLPAPGDLITVRGTEAERDGGMLYRRPDKKDRKKKKFKADVGHSQSGNKKQRNK